MITVTANEIQDNFAKYLQAVQSGTEVIIMLNGKRTARLSPERGSIDTNEFVGILGKDDRSYKEIRDEIYNEKRNNYESLD